MTPSPTEEGGIGTYRVVLRVSVQVTTHCAVYDLPFQNRHLSRCVTRLRSILRSKHRTTKSEVPFVVRHSTRATREPPGDRTMLSIRTPRGRFSAPRLEGPGRRGEILFVPSGPSSVTFLALHPGSHRHAEVLSSVDITPTSRGEVGALNGPIAGDSPAPFVRVRGRRSEIVGTFLSF